MLSTNEIHNGMDYIDSRDIIERIDLLETDTDVNDDDEKEELAALLDLQNQCEGYSSDWNYGATLIRDSYFSTYAQDLAEDIGAISHDENWPLNHIDWDSAVDELQYDYTCVDFDGIEYWIRSC